MAGGGSSGAIAQTLHMLSSTAYDRSLESEADVAAISYLMKAGINPEPFADFLLRIGEDEDISGWAVWISTHPDSKTRSEKVVALSRAQHKAYKQVLNKGEWEKLKADLFRRKQSL